VDCCRVILSHGFTGRVTVYWPKGDVFYVLFQTDDVPLTEQTVAQVQNI